jgi:pentatricopeptide repeat protein
MGVYGYEGCGLLAEVRLIQGKPREARDLFLAMATNLGSDRRDLGLIAAFCRLGDFQSALALYEYAMPRHGFEEWLTDEDPNRPGTRNVRLIEASVLLARAQRLWGFLADRGESDLRRAEKLAPRNAMIAFELGKVLRDNEKFSEATIRFNTAARYGHGTLAKESKRNAEGLDGWVKQVQKEKEELKFGPAGK